MLIVSKPILNKRQHEVYFLIKHLILLFEKPLKILLEELKPCDQS